MHTYKLIDEQDELDSVLVPVMQREGIDVPPAGCYVAAVEFDEDGGVVAYQMLQNALFLEGLWARNHSAHLRNLHNMAVKYAKEKLGAKRWLTMTRDDEQGQRIGRLAEALGYVKQQWNVYLTRNN